MKEHKLRFKLSNKIISVCLMKEYLDENIAYATYFWNVCNMQLNFKSCRRHVFGAYLHLIIWDNMIMEQWRQTLIDNPWYCLNDNDDNGLTTWTIWIIDVEDYKHHLVILLRNLQKPRPFLLCLPQIIKKYCLGLSMKGFFSGNSLFVLCS